MWDFGDGSREYGILNPTHTYESADTYVVRLTLDGPPCANSDTECETTATIQGTAGVGIPEPVPGVVPSTWGRVKADRR
jgi:PKD repeat protein